MGDVLQGRDGQVAVGALHGFEHGQRLGGLVLAGRQDLVHCPQVDGLEGIEGAVGHGSAGAAQGRLLAALGVLLGRAPVHVVAVARVHAAHVDALDGTGLRALEAGLALERARFVVDQQQPAAVARADGVLLLGVAHRQVGAEDLSHGEEHALDDGQARDPFGPHEKYSLTMMMAPAVMKMLSRAAGISHFQAKFIIWSMRTRG